MTTETQESFNIPTDPAILQEIKKGLQEISDSKIRAKAETDLQTATFNKLAESTKVPNGILRKLARIQSEGGVEKLSHEVDQLEALHFAINKKLIIQVNTQVNAQFSEAEIQKALDEATVE